MSCANPELHQKTAEIAHSDDKIFFMLISSNFLIHSEEFIGN